MPLLMSFFLFFASPIFSMSLKPKNLKDIPFTLPPEGPIEQLVYRSTLKDGKPFYESFDISENNTGTSIKMTLNGETNTVLFGDDFNLISAQYVKSGRALDVFLTKNSLLYSTNNVEISRYPRPSSLVIVFPEGQLRNFFYSSTTNVSFTRLLTGDYRAAAMNAYKRAVTNIRTAEGLKSVLPIVIFTQGLLPNEWAMIYYFDQYGWVVRKEGYFNKDPSPKVQFTNPDYTSELIIKKIGKKK